ncbi:GH92 family glycosyl hydrolase [Cerasicoccus arenae]|nr:GH92 family glycosyl hydrolase [Cerasicoccus arenae]MBK1859611.1 GH92 family glycosyl hydrolase [Cerasicoccus arenae]
MNLPETINLLQGTDSTFDFSTGNTLPLVARPWALHHWTLQTAEAPWLFNARHRRLRGLRLTHQPSPWMFDYASLTLLPFTGPALETPELQASAYSLEDSVLNPHYLRVKLMRYGITMEMSPTERGAILVMHFRPDETPRLSFYFDGEHELRQIAPESVGGRSLNRNSDLPEDYGLSFIGRFSAPVESVTRMPLGGYVEFARGTTRVELRLAGSLISDAIAAETFRRELDNRSLEMIREEGAQVWTKFLGRFEIEADSPEQCRLFYSCLYRCLLFPRFLDEIGENGKICHRSPYDGEVHSGSLCADCGFWDVYRTQLPLLTWAYPDITRRMMDAWLNACRQSGWSPKWPSPGPRHCMIGTHFDIYVADVISQGLIDWDVEAAFTYLWKDATELSDNPCFGREGLQEYLKLGFVAADKTVYSLSSTLDYAYDDFCVAQVARFLGKEKEAAQLFERAGNYRHVFDSKTGFMRPRLADGSWVEPFREFGWGGPYVEGGPWQHAFNVPHDPEGLAALYGGPAALCGKLDTMLTMEPRYEAGHYGFEIHEATEMALAGFGQYAHSNQPVHAYLFLYALMGDTAKTSHWVHRVCRELYSIDDFPGDEDNGEMAAWYIWASLGLYPQCPGKPGFVHFEPLLRRVTVRVPERDEVVIVREG